MSNYWSVDNPTVPLSKQMADCDVVTNVRAPVPLCDTMETDRAGADTGVHGPAEHAVSTLSCAGTNLSSLGPYETILVHEAQTGVAVVTMNRPERLNAYSPLMGRSVFFFFFFFFSVLFRFWCCPWSIGTM